MILSVSISPDNNYAISSSFDKNIRVWYLATGELIIILRGHKKELVAVAISLDNKYIISGSSDITIKIWE